MLGDHRHTDSADGSKASSTRSAPMLRPSGRIASAGPASSDGRRLPLRPPRRSVAVVRHLGRASRSDRRRARATDEAGAIRRSYAGTLERAAARRLPSGVRPMIRGLRHRRPRRAPRARSSRRAGQCAAPLRLRRLDAPVRALQRQAGRRRRPARPRSEGHERRALEDEADLDAEHLVHVRRTRRARPTLQRPRIVPRRVPAGDGGARRLAR